MNYIRDVEGHQRNIRIYDEDEDNYQEIDFHGTAGQPPRTLERIEES